MNLAKTALFLVGPVLVELVACAAVVVAAEPEWAAAPGNFMTRWAADVSPERAHPEYPRPQMVRTDWLNLNGLWQYAITARDAEWPDIPDGKILVPYPVESALSGVKKAVGADKRLWYRRGFQVPGGWSGRRTLLHFGAVDWEATVWVNGKEVGTHRGGYDPFSFDITEALKPTGDQQLTVAVWDPTDAQRPAPAEGRYSQPVGKQSQRPRGFYYTAVTGIWQTVWLEPVAEASIERLVMTPDIDTGTLRLSVLTRGTNDGDSVEAVASYRGRDLASSARPVGGDLQLTLRQPRLWSPDSPELYDLRVVLKRGDQTIDEVTSYFGMRKISIGKDEQGHNQLFLNNKRLFQFGLLDQGWWPDGLYTAATDEALRHDVEMTKRLGFNLARKHVKVELARWYTHCDRLGLLVWQDMPSNGREPPDISRDAPDVERTPESREQFYAELKAMIDAHRNHPSIVMWVPFNEGWGQFETKEVDQWVHDYDPSRLVMPTSGFLDRGFSPIHSIHIYPGPAMPALEPERVAILGEFGGLGFPVKGHLWREDRNWGYRNIQTAQELANRYEVVIRHLLPLVGEGLAAAVYTQVSDVEIEVNGMMTYDRAEVKMGAERIAAINRLVYQPQRPLAPYPPESAGTATQWRFTTQEPGDGWQESDFNDSAWQTWSAIAPKLDLETQFWARGSIELSDKRPEVLLLRISNVLSGPVAINGQNLMMVEALNTAHIINRVRPEHRATLKQGKNVISIHCHERLGDRAIDARFTRGQ